MIDFEKLYQDVAEFNRIAGNLDNVTLESIDNQLSFIFEEFSETITGIEEENAKELIDGACDTFVTVAGLLQKLEAAGVDIREAINRVNQNNLSKFVPITEPLLYDPQFTVSVDEKSGRRILKDGNGKIRKPNNFVSVDLQDIADSFKLFKGE